MKVKYSNPGAQAKTILADLSIATGIALEAAPQTINEVLAVRLSNVTLDEAMKRIAWAVDGGWKKVGEGYRLVRSPEQQREEERLLLEETANKFKKILDGRRTALAASPDFTSTDAAKLATEVLAVLKTFHPDDRLSKTWQRSRALDRKGPPGRALDRLALLFDPYELATIPARVQVVYSSLPTPTQRPMGQKALAVVDQYIREQKVWSEEAGKRHIENPRVGSTTYMMGGLTGNPDPITQKIGKVLFTVSKWEVDQPPQLNLIVADEKGKILVEFDGGLGETPDGVVSVPPKPVPSAQPTIKVPEETLAFQRAWVQRSSTPPSSALREKLIHPEKFDPLSIGCGAVLMAIAESQKISMVVDIPDELVITGLSSPEFVPESYLSGFIANALERDKTSGWLLMRPKSPSRSRARHIDRSVLGPYLRKLSANGKVTLDERADYVMHCPEDSISTLQYVLEAAIGVSQTEYFDENTLRLYGSMSPEQKSAAQKGGITYRSLTPAQVKLVQKMLYGPNARLQYDPQMDGRTTQPDYELYYNGIYRETTESLPNGPLANSLLTMRVAQAQVAQSQSISINGVDYGARSFTIDDYAYHRFALEKPEVFPWMADEMAHIDMDHLKLGSQTSYSFTFRFTPDVCLQLSLQTADYGDGRMITYNELPEAFRKGVEQRIEGYRKGYANSRVNDGAGARTPPPPRP